jgi:antibiotic biosynthesis monooxygenase (ABM) superfamily enzyme
MKTLALFIVVFTTVFLFGYTVLLRLDVSLQVMTALFILGNCMVLLMVYLVLKDKYITTKTFEDWYEDRPKSTL